LILINGQLLFFMTWFCVDFGGHFTFSWMNLLRAGGGWFLRGDAARFLRGDAARFLRGDAARFLRGDAARFLRGDAA
jgi:hypothetical protein